MVSRDVLEELGRALEAAALPDRTELDRERIRLVEACAAAGYHIGDPDRDRIVLLLGPSGGGKSTLFNTLTGSTLSRVSSIERPATLGAVAVSKTGSPPTEGIMPTLRHESARESVVRGAAGTITWMKGNPPGHGVLIDAPDFDTRVEANLEVAERLLYWADHIVFVTSVERYADRSATPFLERLASLKVGVTWVLNKTEADAADLADHFKRHVDAVGGPTAETVITIRRTDAPDLSGDDGTAALRQALSNDLERCAVAPRLAGLAKECRATLGKPLADWQGRRGVVLDAVTEAFAIDSRFDPDAALGRLKRFEDDSKFFLRYSPRGLWRGMRRTIAQPKSLFASPTIPDEPEAASVGELVIDQAWHLVELGHIGAREAAKRHPMGRDAMAAGHLERAELDRAAVAERFAPVADRLVTFSREKIEAFRREAGGARTGVVGAVRVWVVDKIARVLALALTLVVLPPLLFELLRVLGHPSFTNEVTQFHGELQMEFERVFRETCDAQAHRYAEELGLHGPTPEVIESLEMALAQIEESCS